MKPSSIKKVFGIPSFFPDNDSDYHIEMRRERTRRFRELLFKLEEFWPNTDILVIAQNWQDFELPEVKNKIKVFHYGKLGILGARKELRKRFLESDYDYMIMLDDDAMITVNEPQLYMDEIDKHPNGFGAIRKSPKPSVLQFFAISKHIYSQVEMPDVDPEQGQGFEDDVFSAQCWGSFPNAGFMFPEGWVNESSLHYFGPGKCPSTWSDERKYDWDHMRTFTKATVYALEHGGASEPEEEPDIVENPTIDVVIPYVNNADVSWIRDFINTTHTHNPNPVRYRSWGTLKYVFRGIAKYMPFVRNLVLVVASPSQVPIWINTENVRVVYHKDFIPEKFLPTFNSCTIESYLWNIPGLSDRIIYFNDDLFPIRKLRESDFFTGNKPHIRFFAPERCPSNNIFRLQCRSSLDFITKILNHPGFDNGMIIRPYHTAIPMVKGAFEYIRDNGKDLIPQTISRLRIGTNINQYIYSYYQYFINDYEDSAADYKYFEVTDTSMDDVMKCILGNEYQMICLNDSNKIKDFARSRYKLQTCFFKRFPIKCKYEG